MFLVVTKGFIQGLEDLEIRGQVETTFSNNSLIRIGQESPGDLRRLAVTQTPVRNYRLTLVWKTRKGVNNNNNDNSGSPNLGQTTRRSDSQQKKENLLNRELCRPGRPQNRIKRKRKKEINIWTLLENKKTM